MLQNLKVLDMVVSLVGALELSFGFSGIDSFQNAKTTEVRERKLKSSDCIASGEILSG